MNSDFRRSLVKVPKLDVLNKSLRGVPDLRQVTTLGFSYGTVDQQYINTIAKNTTEDSRWTAYVYTDSDREVAEISLQIAGYRGALEFPCSKELQR